MRVLLTGASGQLGAYLLREAPDCNLVAWSGSTSGQRFGKSLHPVNLAQPGEVDAAFSTAKPDLILHCAAISRMDRCYQDPNAALQVNARATQQLADLADQRGARLVYVSTDMVFDGEKKSPYSESDEPGPITCYGRSKLRGEHSALVARNSVVARISLLLGPSQHGSETFFDQQCRTLREHRPLQLFTDEWRTPLDLPTAAQALWALTFSDITGLLHIGGPQRLTRWEIGCELARLLHADLALISPLLHAQAPGPEPRPRDLSLDCSRWRSLFPAIPWLPWTEAVGPLLR